MRIVDGARLMRTSFDLVRHDRGLLWFPVASTCCFLLTAAFWLYEGTWVYSVHGPWVLFVPLVLVGMYSVTFVGIFFSVALAGAANGVLDGRGRPSARASTSRGRGWAASPAGRHTPFPSRSRSAWFSG